MVILWVVKVVAKHMAACASTTALDAVEAFGIPKERLFEFWDWVRQQQSAVTYCLEHRWVAERGRVWSCVPLLLLWQVGGRYSVCASPGALPISIKFGFNVFQKFLQGTTHRYTHHTPTSLAWRPPALHLPVSLT